MKIQRVLQVSVLVLASIFFTSVESYGQVDPAWLKSWTEAQEGRSALMTSRGRIGAEGEPGTPFVIRGTVLDPDGVPASAVVVHAYHRDSHGFEFGPGDKALTTWKLQGWVQTDSDGRFEFHTIRPAPDHLGREGSHIHFTLESQDFGRQWAPKIFLSDDPIVTEAQKLRSNKAGELGSVRDVNDVDGIQSIDVRFKLKKSADF